MTALKFQGLSRRGSSLPRNGSGTGKPPERRELFLTSDLAESIELGLLVRQKVSWCVKLDDPSVLKEHNPVVIDHSPQPVRDRYDCTFSELAVGFR